MKPISILRRTRSATRRRLASRPLSATLLAAAITVPAAVAVPAAIAAANSPHRHRQGVTASNVAGAAAARAVAAVQQLVRDSTISPQQATAVDNQIHAGSIDPGQLVDNRVLTGAQGDAVARAIKEALAGSTGTASPGGGEPKGSAGKKGSDRRGSSGLSLAGAAAARAVAAVQQLVRDGTISPQQATAVDNQIHAGSIDPGQLVDNRVLTGAQGDAVARAIKEALAGSTGTASPGGGEPKGSAGKKGSDRRGSSGLSLAGAAAARAVAAVQQLVRDGTISPQQATAVDNQIHAGSIDPGQLVDNRVLTGAQGDAVARAIKEALAGSTGTASGDGSGPSR